jgi:hypothetical protein
MKGPLLPLLLLALLPGLYFAFRLGLLRRPAARWAALGLSLATLAWALPARGLDFVYLKRMNVFLALLALLLVAARHGAGPRALPRRGYLAGLGGLCLASLTVYLNFFSFHGERTWVHLHDVAHYYLGAKYFGELGYENLYTAMLRAELETSPAAMSPRQVRDLSNNELVPMRTLLLRSDEVKAAFTPERWEDWKKDVALFRDQLGPQFATLYMDHGFNPTPLWPVMGGLARLVPAGSRTGVRLLALLDPLLLLLAFAAVVRAFGWEAALLGVIEFCLVYGASFGWTGGAFLRYVWFTCVVVCLCCLKRERYLAAGALLALAATLRVFPAFFALPLALQGLWLLVKERRLPRAHLRFFAGLAATGAALFVVSGAQARGYPAWGEFRHNMGKHMDTVSPNIVGLTNALAWHALPELVTLEELRAEQARRVRVNQIQLATVFALTLVAVALLAPRFTPAEALLLGVPLLLTGLNLASYYYVLLVLLAVAWWDRPWRVAALFGLELVSHAVLLFEDRESLTYIYRSVLLFYLLLAIYFDDLRKVLPRTRREKDAGVPVGAVP